jgi:hypothetical protein
MVIKGNYRGVKANDSPMGGNYALIPEGEYLVAVKHVEQVTSSGGNDMVKTRYIILDEGEWLGKIIFDQIVFCESMAGRNKHVLKVLEQPYEEGKDDEALIIDPQKWIGQKLRVVVYHDVWNEKTRAKVSEYKYKDEKTRLKYASKPPTTKKKEDKPAQESAETGGEAESVGTEEGEEEIPF